MRRGEIWWVAFDPSVGSEIQKTRPAVIVSNDAANRHLPRVVVVPVTSNIVRCYPGETLVDVDGRTSKAMSDQLTTVDKSRLVGKIGEVSTFDMKSIEFAICIHLGIGRFI